MYRFIKKIIRLFRDALNVVKSKRKEQKLNLLHLYKLFIIRFVYGSIFFRNMIYPKKNLLDLKFENDFFLDSENENLLLNNCLNKIYNEGYIDFKNKVKPEIVDELTIDALSSINYKKINNFEFNDIKNLSSFIEKMKSEQIYSLKHNVKIKNSSITEKFVTNDFFINLSQRYLNTNKLSINIQLLISQNLSNKSITNLEYSKASQLYHSDVDFKKFFKLFVYLTNINLEDEGPHEFVPKSHKIKPHELYVTSRFSDDLVKKYYKEKIKFYGNKGTSFIVDTFGIHKGCKLNGAHSRAILVITYGKDHFKFSENTIFYQ